MKRVADAIGVGPLLQSNDLAVVAEEVDADGACFCERLCGHFGPLWTGMAGPSFSTQPVENGHWGGAVAELTDGSICLRVSQRCRHEGPLECGRGETCGAR